MKEPWQTHDEAIAILDEIVEFLKSTGQSITTFKKAIELKIFLLLGCAKNNEEYRLLKSYCTILFEKRHKCESYRKFWEESAGEVGKIIRDNQMG